MSELMPDFDFVDAHVHYWDHDVAGITWPYLEPGFDHPRLRGMHRLDAPRFTDRELRDQAGPYAPSAVVHIQSCTEERPGLETAWIQQIADDRGAVDAIVAKALVAKPDIDDVLAANQCRLLRGFRDMSSPRSIGSDEFTRGFDCIAAAGLSLEVLVPHPKFADVCSLADRHPDALIVLGHAGQPERRDDDYFAAWSAELGSFADRPNVVVKISALASGADPDWTVDSLRRWFDTCIEVFGPDRSMLATNWPIDRLYGTYPGLFEAYAALADPMTASERSSLFAGTARRVYDIGVGESANDVGRAAGVEEA